MSNRDSWRAWTPVHCAVCLLGLLWGFLPNAGVTAMLFFAFFGASSFTVLLQREGGWAFKPQNLVTLARVVFGLGILIFHGSPAVLAVFVHRFADRAAATGASGAGYALFALFAFVGATDFVDGVVARKLGASEFGAKLDLETDAFFMGCLSLLAVARFPDSPWLLGIGLIRYAFFFLLVWTPEAPRRPSAFRWYAKAVCAVSVIFLVGLWAPFLPLALRLGLNAVSLALLAVSFTWELALNVIHARDAAEHPP